MNPFWDKKTALHLLDRLGKDGRKEYASVYTGLISDVTLAFCYTMMFASALYVLQPHHRWLCLIAILCGLCDLCENYCIYTLIATYPDMDEDCLKYGPMATKGKYLFMLIILPATLIGLCCGGSTKEKDD